MKRLAGVVIVAFALSLVILRAASAQPPAGFESQTLIIGLDQPTGLAFTPDGRMLITERTGAIKIVQPGATQVDATPLLTVANINTDQGERGLVGMTLDPNFAANGYFYIFYTANSPLRDRVSRFTASGNTTVPGSELVVNRDMHEDVYVALRDAFDAAKRQMEDYGRRQRGDIKTHEGALHGHVARISPDGFGFIETADGQEYYFNRDNVAHPNFDKLEVGNQVQFIEEAAAEGLQAKRISVGKHQFPG